MTNRPLTGLTIIYELQSSSLLHGTAPCLVMQRLSVVCAVAFQPEIWQHRELYSKKTGKQKKNNNTHRKTAQKDFYLSQAWGWTDHAVSLRSSMKQHPNSDKSSCQEHQL